MLEFFGRLLRRLAEILGLERGDRPPGSLAFFIAEVEMSNVRLSWELPNVSSRQREISHVLIESRVSQDLPWALVNTVEATETTLLIEQLAPGTWEFRGTVVDVDDRRSPNPKTAVVTIDFDPPSDLVEFTADLE